MENIQKIISRDTVLSMNVLAYIVLFIIPFGPTWWFWPYPLYLAILEPVFYQLLGLPPESSLFTEISTILFYLVVWMVGLYIAFLVGQYFSKRNRQKERPWTAYWWTPLVWIGLLILIEAAIFLFVSIGLGIPVGE